MIKKLSEILSRLRKGEGQPAAPAASEWLDALDSDSEEERAEAISKIGAMGPSAIPMIMKRLKGADNRRARRIGDALASIRPQGVQSLYRAVYDPESVCADEALVAYRHIAVDRVEDLIELFRDADGVQATQIAYHLYDIGLHAGPALVNALKDEDVMVRRGVAQSISIHQKPPDFLAPALAEALEDKDDRVRYYAVVALAGIGRESVCAVPQLIVCLGDSNQDVRETTARCLGAIGPEARPALPTLFNMLGEDLEVARAMGRIVGDDKKYQQHLKEWMRVKSTSFPAAVALAYSESDEQAIVNTLMQTILEQHDPGTIGVAVDAIAEMGPAASGALPELARLAKDGRFDNALTWKFTEAIRKIKKG